MEGSAVRCQSLLASSILFFLSIHAHVLAQLPDGDPADPWRPAAVYDDAVSLQPPTKTPRIQMFRMLPGFLSDAPAVINNDDTFTRSDTAQSGSDGLAISFGEYNPFFELRRPGDPGGVGYLYVQSQLQLLELDGTSVSLGLRGWTPAGAESGGLQQGPTTIAPGLGIFQDLGDGTALQGYVDQNIHGACKSHGPMHYGMALQCPLTPWADPGDGGVYFFMQALGRYDYLGGMRGQSWELLPGVHWRLSDNFSLSIGGIHSSMLTWTWQF
jgi:hypothetical protein